MAPEYGATMGFFPVDDGTLLYLRTSNRDTHTIELVEKYSKEQMLFRTDATKDPVFSDTLELDLGSVVPSMAGPKRPQDRLTLPEVRKNFRDAFKDASTRKSKIEIHGESCEMESGAVVIAAITSCTNTSNPSVMIAAGLLAKKAVAKGLKSKPWVKTSLAPGSRVVTEYLDKSRADSLSRSAELQSRRVWMHNLHRKQRAPLPDAVSAAVKNDDLVVAAVLSGNRNFEGRINPQVKANYLASPPLVVAYALAGRVDFDMAKDSLGNGSDGAPVYLKDIWPTPEEISSTIAATINAGMFAKEYAKAFEGDSNWQHLPVPTGGTYLWDDASTYIKKPPYFDNMTDPNAPIADIKATQRCWRCSAISITTDQHLAGRIDRGEQPRRKTSACRWESRRRISTPTGQGAETTRRVVRGTLANVRLKNQLAPGTEGPWTVHSASEGEQMFIYDASGDEYQQEGTPLLILAGKEYGSGSSRDWAAKGVKLLGVTAVIAESLRAHAHRTNLVGMGVLPASSTSRVRHRCFAQAYGEGTVPHRGRQGSSGVRRARFREGHRRGRHGNQLRSSASGRHSAGSRIFPQRRNSTLRTTPTRGSLNCGRAKAWL